MSLHKPTRVGSEPDEAPAATWDLSIELEFDPRLRPERIQMLQDDLFDAVAEVVKETIGPHVVGRPDVWLHDKRGCGRETPLFPMVAGDARFTCDLDVKEMIERACEGTPVSLMAHDACGRAYELTVAPVYLRRPKHDLERVAQMPDPERYAALGRGEVSRGAQTPPAPESPPVPQMPESQPPRKRPPFTEKLRADGFFGSGY